MRGAPSSSAAASRGANASPRSGSPHRALHRRSDFHRVFRSGTRRRSGGIVVITISSEPGPARLGLVVGRRVGGAVARNRAKRRLRAAAAQVALRSGHDYVVIAGDDVLRAPFEELQAWIRHGAEVGT